MIMITMERRRDEWLWCFNLIIHSFKEDDEDDEELKRRGELTEADVEAMFEGAEDKDLSVDHQDDDEGPRVEYEEIIIREEPQPKVAGATMRFG